MTYEDIKNKFKNHHGPLSYIQMMKLSIMARWCKEREFLIADLLFLSLFLGMTIFACFFSGAAAIMMAAFTIMGLNTVLSHNERSFAFILTDLSLDYCKYMEDEFDKITAHCKELAKAAAEASSQPDEKAQDEQVPETKPVFEGDAPDPKPEVIISTADPAAEA